MRALLLGLAACWTSSPPPSPPVTSTFEITLERTPCLGRCPVYRVTLDGDGRITWEGQRYVATPGRRTATVPPRRVRAVEQKVADVRFFERDANGDLPRTPTCVGGACSFPADTICSDTSAAILTVRRGDRVHTVRNDHCEPSPLDALETLVDDVTRTTIWIHQRVVSPPSADPPRSR